MTANAPIPDYSAAREAMIASQLKPQGVNDPELLAAMGKIARERFVPEEVRPLAYIDRSVPIGGGRMMAPAPAIGLLLTQLAPERGEHALVIGAGSGYSAALLAELGLDVTAVESSPELAQAARANGVSVVEGPLEAGHKRSAPYDLIFIDGAVEVIPDSLLAQLKDGGRLGAAVLDRGITRLVVGRKVGGAFGSYSISDAAVPRLPGFERSRAFTF